MFLNEDFINLYEELSSINGASLQSLLKETSDSRETVIEIKGRSYKSDTQFMPIADIFKADMSKPGIYIWWRLPYENVPSAYYVGQAVDIRKRTLQHKQAPIENRDSPALHAAIKKYGLNQFKIAVLEFCHINELNNRERRWIEELNTYHSANDYNLTPGGQNSGGYHKVTLEMFEQIVTYLQDISSAALTFKEIGRRLSLNHSTISTINAGKHPHTEDFIKRLNLDITFPIRSAEQQQQLTRAAQKATGRKRAVQSQKTWKLTLTHNRLSDDGHTVIKAATEDLGIFVGRPAVREKIYEIEQTVYKTATEEIDRAIKNLYKAPAIGGVGFIPITPKKYARRYTIQEIN